MHRVCGGTSNDGYSMPRRESTCKRVSTQRRSSMKQQQLETGAGSETSGQSQEEQCGLHSDQRGPSQQQP